ncbi:MAG: hypothetical protein JW946_00380 [Candidatus Omnitrophica bacterium]|nr:hypothetical protein [Candidatus Omnitrophota bacterium]
MNKKMLVYILVIGAIAIGLLLSANQLKAQEEKTMNEAAVSAQLQQVIQNQQVILSKLNDIQKELEIVKIRTTAKRVP